MSNSAQIENSPKNIFYYLCLCLCLAIILSFSTINLYKYLQTGRVLGIKTEQGVFLDKQQVFWISVLDENPNYFMAWIELANIYSQNGEFDKASDVLARAEEINPNSDLVNTIKTELKSKIN